MRMVLDKYMDLLIIIAAFVHGENTDKSITLVLDCLSSNTDRSDHGFLLLLVEW